MRYQFHVDGRMTAPVRDRWEAAAQDAVSAGYAVWVGDDRIRMADGAEIWRGQ